MVNDPCSLISGAGLLAWYMLHFGKSRGRGCIARSAHSMEIIYMKCGFGVHCEEDGNGRKQRDE